MIAMALAGLAAAMTTNASAQAAACMGLLAGGLVLYVVAGAALVAALR